MTTKSINEKYCSACGALISAQAEICPKCGVRQSPAPFPGNLGNLAPNGRSRLAAALFAIFLGSLGIHKFYLGRVGWGVIYLLLCWTVIPGIVGFIEGILLLIMSEEDFNAKYGND
ncbi:NINE protein [Chlorobium phaeovibrioides]|uniref:TM2 domain containing protein+B7201 n=1 Tax=Chlorobium phaeovibrioides (strain DSM 265 / 1930) TaxID=290318 RepID=A4SD17_CHLPM|nr:NINE protein [Chlorobium phaeovibrioides]RTY36080.1 NINE protein [Chlorobium phaeovibrioides]HCD36679.1 NINE protein [Chlorobium sp.]